VTEEEKEAAAKTKSMDDAAKIRASEMLEKYKDAARLAEELADARNENFKLCGDKRELDKEVKDLAAEVPAEGAIILAGDALTKYNALVALGSPDDIKKRLDNEAVLVAKDAAQAKRGALDEAVKLTGYDPAAVALLNGALDLSYVVDKETKDGKEVLVPYVQDGDKKRPAGEVLAEKFGQPLLDRMRLEQSAEGTVVSAALSGTTDTKATEEAARASQANLYGGSNF